jgi:hypothetical protein
LVTGGQIQKEKGDLCKDYQELLFILHAADLGPSTTITVM